MRPWMLAETHYGHVKETRYDVAIVPLGATEPHNLHLPYGTDVFEATVLAERLGEFAHERGASVVVLPTIPFGVERNLSGFPLAINVDPETLDRYVADVVRSLADNGIRKIVLLNSHGGNEFKPLLRGLYGKLDAHLFLCNWYRVIDDCYDDLFTHREDHAGEMETSFALAYFPHLVQLDAKGNLAADHGVKRPFRFKALREGWVGVTRPWHLLTTNSGAADPHQATKEKGERLMQILLQRLGGFLVELAQADLDESFPFA